MAQPLQSTSSPTGHDPQAIRLTFSFAGDRIELTQTRRLPMFIEPSDPLEPQPGQSGFWLEVRGADERPLFRRVMRHPIDATREVFPKDLHGEFTRLPVANPTGVFTVVIPEFTEARTLVFVGSPRQAYDRAATEMARFDLSKIAGSDYDK
jgi:hypothetical protein